MAGYIKLHRGWRDCEVFVEEQFSEREAWLWLLENAAWKDTHRRAAKGNVVPVKRGQIHVSERALSRVWKWDRKRISRFFKRLESALMIVPSTGPHGCLITIENYERFQGEGANHGATDGTNRGANHGATQEEGKEGEEENKYAFAGRVVRLNFRDFARWRKAYPDLDLHALLNSRDDWLSGQSESDRKRWFQSTSSWLANKQQEATAQNRKNGSAGEIW